MSRGRRRNRPNPSDVQRAAVELLEKALSPNLVAGAQRRAGGMSLVDAARLMTGQAPAGNGTFTAVPMPRSPLDEVPFGPLWPLQPMPIDPARRDTGRPEPRISEYPVAWNVPGSGERAMPWRILRDAADGVDIIRRCIQIRQRHIRGLDGAWSVSEKAVQETYRDSGGKLGREDAERELREKYLPEIRRMETFWKHPWKSNGWSFGQWVNAVIEEHLVLDAVAVYPRATYGGDVLALEVLDGTTIKPLLDYRGARPQAPNPAFQQLLYGFPRGEWHATPDSVDAEGNAMVSNAFLADQLFYGVENVRPFTPYGYSAVEQALISAKLYLARQGWMISEYDDGIGPMVWLVPQAKGQGYSQINNAVDGMTPQMRRDWQDSINALLSGNTKARHRAQLSLPGMTPIFPPTVDERYKPEYDLHLIKLLAGHFGVTMTELGFTEAKGLGNSGLHEGQADVEQRVGQRPDERMIAELINELSHDFMRCPPEVCFRFTSDEAEETVDQDAVAKSRRERATITLNDDRREAGLAPLDIPEADMPLILQGGQWMPLEGLAERAKQEQELAQQMAQDQLATSEQDRELAQQSADLEAETAVAESEEEMVKAVERRALARFRNKGRNRGGRPFICKHLAPADFAEGVPPDVDFEGWAWVPDGLDDDATDDEIAEFLGGEISKAFGRGNDNWRTLARDSRGRWVARGSMRVSPLGPDRPSPSIVDGLRANAAGRRAGFSAQEMARAQAEYDSQAGPGARGEARRRLMEGAGITPLTIAQEHRDREAAQRREREQMAALAAEQERRNLEMLRAHAANLDPADIEAGMQAELDTADRVARGLGVAGGAGEGTKRAIRDKWADPDRQAVLVAEHKAALARQRAAQDRAGRVNNSSTTVGGMTNELSAAREARDAAARRYAAAGEALRRAKTDDTRAEMAAAIAENDAATRRLRAAERAERERTGADGVDHGTARVGRGEGYASEGDRVSADDAADRARAAKIREGFNHAGAADAAPGRFGGGKRTFTVTLPNGDTATRTSSTRDYTHGVILTKDNEVAAQHFDAEAAKYDRMGKPDMASRKREAAARHRALPRYEHDLVSMSASEKGAEARARQLSAQAPWFSASVTSARRDGDSTADAATPTPAAVESGAGVPGAQQFAGSVATSTRPDYANGYVPMAERTDLRELAGHIAQARSDAENPDISEYVRRTHAERLGRLEARAAAAQEAHLRDAVTSLQAEPGAWVSLTDVRARLAERGMDRAQQDATLKRMITAQSVVSAPEENQKTLNDADRAAALHIGGEDKHLVMIEPPRAAAPVKLSRAATVKLTEMAMAQGNAASMPSNVRRPDVEELERAGYAVRDGNWSVLTDAGRAAAPAAPEPTRPDFTMTRREGSALARKAGNREALRQGRAANAAAREQAAEGPRDKGERLAREREAADPLGEAARLEAVAERWDRVARSSAGVDRSRDNGMAQANADYARAEAARIRQAQAAVGAPPAATPAPDPTPVSADDTGRAAPTVRPVTIPASITGDERKRLEEFAVKNQAGSEAAIREGMAELDRDITSTRAFLNSGTDLDPSERAMHETRLAQSERLAALPRGDAALNSVKAARDLVAKAEAEGYVVRVGHFSASGGAPYFTVEAMNPETKNGFKATWHSGKGDGTKYGLDGVTLLGSRHGYGGRKSSLKGVSEAIERDRPVMVDTEALAAELDARRNVDPSVKMSPDQVQAGDWRWNSGTREWEQIGMIADRPGAVGGRTIWGMDRETRLGAVQREGALIARQAERPTLPPRSEGLKGLQRKPGEAAKRGDVYIVERAHELAGPGGTRGKSYETYEVTGVTREGKVARVRRLTNGPDSYEQKMDQFGRLGRQYGTSSLIPGDRIDKEGLAADLRAHTYPDSTSPRDYDDLRALGDVLYGRMKPEASAAPARQAPSAQSVNDAMAAQALGSLSQTSRFGEHGTVTADGVKPGMRLMWNGHEVEVLEAPRRAARNAAGQQGHVFRVRRVDGTGEGVARLNIGQQAALAPPRGRK